MLRNIIEIDETKCDGCGLCIPACEEGAIRLVAGKARVVSDAYCDGLGACLGHCPRGAISIVQRAAAPFDHAAVVEHLAASKRDSRSQHGPAPRQCPGTTSMQLQVIAPAPAVPCSGAAELPADASPHHISQLANWPVQLRLVSPSAPYLRGADLLLVADCVPLSMCGLPCPDSRRSSGRHRLPQARRRSGPRQETVRDHSNRPTPQHHGGSHGSTLLHGPAAHCSSGGTACGCGNSRARCGGDRPGPSRGAVRSHRSLNVPASPQLCVEQ